jgi:hypothetical protein
MVEAMERMFNEHFLRRVVKLHNNIAQPTHVVVSLAIVDSMGEVLLHVVFTPMCSLMMKIIVCSPKEKFSKRHVEGPMEANPSQL